MNFSSKHIWLLLCVGISMGVTAVATARPNIILILADDLGYGDLGFQGSTQIPTPNIDRLARSGVQFTQAYVSSPVCSPSRAGLLTGRNQVSFGYDNNLEEIPPAGFDPEFSGLPVSENTVADRLKAMGYATGLVGKWHLGYRLQFHPLQRGFKEFWGFLGGSHRYFTTSPGGIECNYKNPGAITYLTDDIGAECVDFIHRHKEESFFLFASFNAPHAPMQALAADLPNFNSIIDRKRRTYCAMVYRLDINVGRILDALTSTGLTTNTIVVFLSDNGGPVNENSSLNAPLSGQKGTLLEGGLRVPFIISWPGRIDAESVFRRPVTSLDLCPTFLAAAGANGKEANQMDGLDLMPYLVGQLKEIPHQNLNWRFTISAAIRQGDWKLIRLPDRLPMLFNLADDISEQHDVAIDHIDLTKELLKRLGDWDVQLPHPVSLESAGWKRRQLNSYDISYSLSQPPNPPRK